MPNGRRRRTSLTPRDLGRLTGDDVAEIIAYAESKHGAEVVGRRSNLRLARRDAALVRVCAAGAFSPAELAAASSMLDIAVLDQRLEAFLASPPNGRRRRPRLRLVCSKQKPARRGRYGSRPTLRLVRSPMLPAGSGEQPRGGADR